MDRMNEKTIHGNETVVIEIPGVATWPITHLRDACKRNKVKGYTKMDREQLIEEVKNIMANFEKVDSQ